MSDGIFSFSDSRSATPPARGTPARAWSRVRVWILQRRRHQTLAQLDDWILRDIGVIRERDLGADLGTDAREAATRFWPP